MHFLKMIDFNSLQTLQFYDSGKYNDQHKVILYRLKAFCQRLKALRLLKLWFSGADYKFDEEFFSSLKWIINRLKYLPQLAIKLGGLDC